jgi:TonB family protein
VRLVLHHELEHIRRGDWIVQLLGEILRAVYWFNPLVWIVCRRLRYESEHACDDAVLSRGVQPTDYAALLVDLARTLNAGRTIRVPAPAMARASSLEGRVSAMLNARLNRRPITRSTRIATVILFLCVTVPLSGLAAQRFSTFSGTLVDQTNAVLPNVAVTLTNPAAQTRHEVRTDRTGHFELLGLPDGEYQLSIAAAGFATVIEPIPIAGRDVTRTFQLRVGDLHETISITSGGPEYKSDPELRAKARQRAEQRMQKVAERCGGNGAAAGGVGGNILQPTKIADVKPRYPENLQAARVGGVVILEVLIGTDGTVRDVQVSSGDPDLGHAAVEAIRQWEFSPTYLNCTPVEVRMGVTATFVAQ